MFCVHVIDLQHSKEERVFRVTYMDIVSAKYWTLLTNLLDLKFP